LKLSKELFFSFFVFSSSYIALTALGIKQKVEQIKANVLFNVYKHFFCYVY